jgi:hypothetical protein
MTGKTYIDFLNENFDLIKHSSELGRSKYIVRGKENCPVKFERDAILGGIPRVLAENYDQYLPEPNMTLNKMAHAWGKQAPKIEE